MLQVLLMDPRVDPNIACIDGRTPLLIAAYQGHDAEVTTLSLTLTLASAVSFAAFP